MCDQLNIKIYIPPQQTVTALVGMAYSPTNSSIPEYLQPSVPTYHAIKLEQCLCDSTREYKIE